MKTQTLNPVFRRSALALTAIALVVGCSATDEKKEGSGGTSSAGTGGLGFGGSSSGGSSSGGSSSGGSSFGGSSFGGSSFGGASSGGSGGEGDTGSGGVAGGEPVDACEECFDTNCSTQSDACEANADCGALLDCWDQCTDEACYETCYTTHAAGAPLVDAMIECEQLHCATQCPED
jgi:hypothetical protein